MHINAFEKKGHYPKIDQRVTFSMSTDKRGRPCAASVALLGEESANRFVRNFNKSYIAVAVTFLAVVGVSVAMEALPLAVLLIYAAASALTYFVYAWDKVSAKRGARRTQESALHILSLLGGWPGALIAQQTLRHKSSKEEFRFMFWLTVIVNCAILVWLFTDSGSMFFESLLKQVL